MKSRVLVFPCGSEIGLEIHKSINNSIHFELIGLSSISDHGKFVYKNYIEGISYYNSDTFINELIEIIKKEKIDILYPTMDTVITLFKKNDKPLNLPIVGSDAFTCCICENKSETYKLLEHIIKVPKVYNKLENLTFPLFVKPIIGYGSRGTYKVNSIDELKGFNYERDLLLEFLPGAEYTIDCFSDIEGKLKFVGARERSRTINGISVNTKTNNSLSNEFIPIAEKINSVIKFKGSWFFQMKRNKSNEPVLLEIASRFAGSSSVHRAKGINFALANLFLSLNKNVEFIINKFDVELDRALENKYKFDINFENVYIDFDDTIITNSYVNVDAISFIYKCLNLNKKIILITKHADDINTTLTKYNIPATIFSKIIQIKKTEEKRSYIDPNNYKNSIFIDDSFEERKHIFKELGIPVFGVDLLNSII
jgi:predicted ATP-grasp superfamily ATP-dependent carboligase